MPRFFLSAPDPENGYFDITGDSAHHISFSLRMRCGEHITVCDGEGYDYECVIQSMDGQTVRAEILEKKTDDDGVSCKDQIVSIRSKGG